MKSFSFGKASFGAVVNLLLLTTCLSQTYAALRGDDCEVCIKVLTRFQESLKDEQKGDPVKIEKAFKKFCKGVKGKDERFCYYLGGLETSATKIVGEMARPLSYSKPIEKICEDLKKKDIQICELKYDKQVDFTTVDFNKLKVRDLRKILADWGEDDACKGCAEKSDFIRKIKELLPKYAPEAAARREEL